MKIKKELKWLCEHSKQLEQFSGNWVMFSINEGVVSQGRSLERIIKEAKEKKSVIQPFVLHVPSKDELKRSL